MYQVTTLTTMLDFWRRLLGRRPRRSRRSGGSSRTSGGAPSHRNVMAESRRALATDDLHRRWMLADETPDDGWLEEYAAEAEEFYDVCGRGR